MVAWGAPGRTTPIASPGSSEGSNWGCPVVGLSFGAALALELYRRHPAIPQSLVLASAYAGWGGSLPSEVAEQRREQALRDSERPPAEWVPEWAPGALAPRRRLRCAMSSSQPCPSFIRWGIARRPSPSPTPTCETSCPKSPYRRSSSMERRISAHRSLSPRSSSEIDHSRLELLPGVGHLPNLEEPERFNQG